VPNSSTLIYGERDAVLVDTFLTAEASRALADWAMASGKNLTTIYLTHSHGDHFFGIGLLKQRFPHARAVARPDIVEAMRHELDPPYFNSFWNSCFPGQLPEQLAVAEALEGNTIELEGHELVVVDTGFTESARPFHRLGGGRGRRLQRRPSLANRVCLGQRSILPKTVDCLPPYMKPRAVIAGHKRPENDDHPRIIEGNAQLLPGLPALQRGDDERARILRPDDEASWGSSQSRFALGRGDGRQGTP